MISYTDTPLYGVTITIIIFSLFQYLNKKTKISLLNPIALSIITIILILRYYNIDYDVYNKGGSIISFFLGPATVVLAIPLYNRIKLLGKNFFPITIGIIVGSLSGIISLVLLSKLFKLDHLIALSLIPKSTTSAIAVDIARGIGGSPSLAIAFVTATGISGNIIGPGVLKFLKINNRIAKGIAIGTSSHVIGTAKAVEMGEVEGAMSSLAIGIAGLITVFLAPLVLSFISML